MKHFKKLIIFGNVAIVLLVFGITFMAMTSNEGKRAYDVASYTTEQIKFLRDKNFTASKSLDLGVNYDAIMNPNLVERYETLTGLRYFSEEGLAAFLHQYKLVAGAAGLFKEEIPPANIAEMMKGMSKIPPESLNRQKIGSERYYVVDGAVPEASAGGYINDLSTLNPSAREEMKGRSYGYTMSYISAVKVANWPSDRMGEVPNWRIGLSKDFYVSPMDTTAQIVILAPVSMFNMTGNVVETDGFIHKYFAPRPDPAAFAKINDGYLLLTKW